MKGYIITYEGRATFGPVGRGNPFSYCLIYQDRRTAEGWIEKNYGEGSGWDEAHKAKYGIVEIALPGDDQ